MSAGRTCAGTERPDGPRAGRAGKRPALPALGPGRASRRSQARSALDQESTAPARTTAPARVSPPVHVLFAISGASIDTSLAGAYSLAQYFGWDWGKYRRPAGAPRFTLTWLGMLGIAVVVTMTGVDPIKVTEYSVIFSAVALPFTFLPVLLVARDPNYMGEYANGGLGNFLGWFYLVVIVVIALTAIPLMILTGMGRG